MKMSSTIYLTGHNGAISNSGGTLLVADFIADPKRSQVEQNTTTRTEETQQQNATQRTEESKPSTTREPL